MLITPHHFKGIKLLTQISIMIVCSLTKWTHCITENFKVEMRQVVTWLPSAHGPHDSVVTQTSSHSGLVTLLTGIRFPLGHSGPQCLIVIPDSKCPPLSSMVHFFYTTSYFSTSLTSTLKIKALFFFKILIPTYQTKWWHNQKTLFWIWSAV
jgi:hypothetical protein